MDYTTQLTPDFSPNFNHYDNFYIAANRELVCSHILTILDDLSVSTNREVVYSQMLIILVD